MTSMSISADFTTKRPLRIRSDGDSRSFTLLAIANVGISIFDSVAYSDILYAWGFCKDR